MVCPYAANVKGAVAYCTIIKKKVSTLKYPCKGNYKRCPVYARRPVRVEEPKPEPKPVVKKEVEVASIRQEKESEVRKPEPAVAPVVASEPPVEVKPVEVKASQAPESKIKWRPGGAICDSLLLAVLVTVAEAVGVIKGNYKDLEGKLVSLHTNGSFIFIAGRVGNIRVRMTYSSGYIFSIMAEHNGSTVCGSEALKKIEPITEKPLDLVLYSVSWNSLDKWGESLRKDLENAMKQ